MAVSTENEMGTRAVRALAMAASIWLMVCESAARTAAGFEVSTRQSSM